MGGGLKIFQILKPKTMSTKTKFYKLLTGLMLLSTVTFAQLNYPHKLLEFRSIPGSLTGNGFGPRTTNHVLRFDRDSIDNNNFVLQTVGTNPVLNPLTSTFKLENQQYTGFTYGAGTVNLFNGAPNSISTGLVFGAGPSNASGPAPGSPNVQQVTPLNSYDLLGYFNGGGGPRNGMFKSNCSNPAVANYPGASGTGIDAEYLLPGCCANDGNGGVQIFTAAQRMFDLNNPGGTNDRYYYGDLTISFNQFVDSAVIHVAGLGGSYRYFIGGGSGTNLADWRQTFFSTELELVWPNYSAVQVTKMAGNQFFSVSGKNILNNAITPNGESIDIGVIPLPNWNNFGAATGSFRVTGARTDYIKFKVWLRGANANNTGTGFKWSAPGALSGASRDPLTGDIWYISASVKSPLLTTSCPLGDPSCTSLPANGINLTAALNGSDVQLNWKTQSEINSNYFVIERSTDGINFSSIGTKQAAGNSSIELTYSQVDPNMSVPAYYYRLKLVDIDGRFSYSNIALVRKSGIKGVKVFPNPVTSQVNIEFSNAKGNYEITVYNQLGQNVISKAVTISSTVQYVNLSKGTLASGSYLISAKNTETNEKYVQNVIFQ
jgi:hypothetical protein